MTDCRCPFRAVHILLICAVSALFSASVALAEDPGILWEKKGILLEPGPHEEKAGGRFTFTNTGDSPLGIRSIKTTCGCTAAEAGGANDAGQYAPGTQGHIKTTVSFSRGAGTLRKSLYVTFARGEESFVEKLTVGVRAPAYVELSSNFLSWQHGQEKPDPQTVQMKVLHSSPIHLVDVKQQGDGAFDVERGTVEKGKRYEVTVTPADLTEQKTLRITLVTDFPSPDNPLTYDLRATVRPKLPPQPEQPGMIMAILQTSEGLLAVGGIALALIVGSVTIVLVLRTPKKTPGAEGK